MKIPDGTSKVYNHGIKALFSKAISPAPYLLITVISRFFK
jgi:hypothetical protein